MPNVLPDIIIETRLSDGLYQLTRGPRLLNQYARVAMGAELVKHHNTRIPQHFKLGAHNKYGYATRKASTMKKKERYWKKNYALDLVRSGQSEKTVTQRRQITFGGAFGGMGSDSTLQGRLNMVLPRVLLAPPKGGISPEQIAKEIAATTETENREIAEGFRDRIVNQINAYHGPMRYLRRTGGNTVSRYSAAKGNPIGGKPGGIFTNKYYGPGF